MKSLKINDKLYVNILSVKIPEKELIIEAEPQNQFLIFDRSGSMYWYLNDIMEYAKEYCKTLPDGSTVYVGYFSGDSQYGLSVPYILQKEINGLVTTLDGYKSAMGLTNFVEIIWKVNQVADTINGKSSLFFFTDGCHNQGGTWSDIEKQLLVWKQFAQVTMLIGHGYIDRDMMKRMAEITEGSFIHLNEFHNVKLILEDFRTAVEESQPTIPVDIEIDEPIHPISISGRSINLYNVLNGQINFKPGNKSFNGVFFVTRNKIEGSEETNVVDITVERGIRALAVIHSQRNDVQTSLELLSCLGDKFLLKKMFNAISPDEFALAEYKTRRSVFYPKERFIEGCIKDYLPKDNEFCVLDALQILTEDENAKLHVRDDEFEYTKISSPSVQTDGSKIQYPSDIAVDVNSISFHSERLNVNISTSVKAIVNLIPSNFNTEFNLTDIIGLGFDIDYPVTQFKTYSIITDGRLNVKKLIVSGLSKDSVFMLSEIIEHRNDGKYIINLSQIPLINRMYVKNTSAKTLAMSVWEERLLKDKLSVLNYFKKCEEEAQGKIVQREDLSPEQALFLKEKCYIKNGSYNPPVQRLCGNDEYEAYSFKIGIKGFSKISAGQVAPKIEAMKKLSQREMIIGQAWHLLENEFDTTNLDKLAEKIDEVKKELKPITRDIQIQKFSIILGNRGKMDEFEKRGKNELDLSVSDMYGEYHTVTFEFDVSKIKVVI